MGYLDDNLTPIDILKKIGKYRITIEEFGEEVIFEETTFYTKIEKALKDVQELKLKNLSLEAANTSLQFHLDLGEAILKGVDRKLKAFNIIREKVSDIGAVRIASSVEDYNIKENGFIPLTKEEFTLLKEELK